MIIAKIIKTCIRSVWEESRCKYDPNTNEYITRLWLYPAWWKLKFGKNQDNTINPNNFFTAIPNRGAGIGHQISNWQSGLWFSQVFGVQHAHVPFAQKSWEHFLNYGAGDPLASDLKRKGYRTVHLPIFHEDNEDEMQMIRRMMAQYNQQRVVFYAEQDQSFRDQYTVMDTVRERFFQSVVRKSDLTPFSPDHYNIAIHLRRGDIVIGQANGNPNLLMRWLDNNYYRNVLEQALKRVKTDKEIHIYIFSQGREEDYPEFCGYPNVHFFLDLNPESTFLSFVYADLLITSKSSFSYKPALLNRNGKKICPRNFWHGYPETDDWILAEDDGTIDAIQMQKLDRLS